MIYDPSIEALEYFQRAPTVLVQPLPSEAYAHEFFTIRQIDGRRDQVQFVLDVVSSDRLFHFAYEPDAPSLGKLLEILETASSHLRRRVDLYASQVDDIGPFLGLTSPVLISRIMARGELSCSVEKFRRVLVCVVHQNLSYVTLFKFLKKVEADQFWKVVIIFRDRSNGDLIDVHRAIGPAVMTFSGAHALPNQVDQILGPSDARHQC